MAGPGGQLCGPDQGAFRERPRAMAGPGGQLCGPDQGAITRKAPRNGGAGGPALRPGSRGHNAKGPAQWRGLPGPICGPSSGLSLHKARAGQGKRARPAPPRQERRGVLPISRPARRPQSPSVARESRPLPPPCCPAIWPASSAALPANSYGESGQLCPFTKGRAGLFIGVKVGVGAIPGGQLFPLCPVARYGRNVARYGSA